MKPYRLQLFLLFILTITVFGQIQNGGFELPEDVNETQYPYFNPPADWVVTNYGGVVEYLIPTINYGQPVDWNIPAPYDGNFFLVLSTGDMGADSDRLINRAEAAQRVFVPAYSIIEGVYFFGTCDYMPFRDLASIDLIPYIDPNSGVSDTRSTIVLANCSVDIVGSYQSTEEWKPFSYIVDANQEGLYDLIISVQDGGGDNVYESYLALDALSICGPGELMGDINADCYVDMQDLSQLSQYWLCECVDPNVTPIPESFLSDPNSYSYQKCLFSDLDRSVVVEPNDLALMSENWLKPEED